MLYTAPYIGIRLSWLEGCKLLEPVTRCTMKWSDCVTLSDLWQSIVLKGFRDCMTSRSRWLRRKSVLPSTKGTHPIIWQLVAVATHLSQALLITEPGSKVRGPIVTESIPSFSNTSEKHMNSCSVVALAYWAALQTLALTRVPCRLDCARLRWKIPLSGRFSQALGHIVRESPEKQSPHALSRKVALLGKTYTSTADLL